jgi:hypothetical protein
LCRPAAFGEDDRVALERVAARISAAAARAAAGL